MINLIKQYTANKLELLKLEATEKYSNIISTVITYALIAFVSFFIFILTNISIVLLIGYYLENYAYAALIMVGFYLLVLLILIAMKKSIKLYIINKIIKTINSK